MQLEILWYGVIGVSILFYTVLDGFDLGVGALHLFCKGDEQRRTFLNAIGPVWDMNEVWIVIVMGALFAGFPNAYATVFSGFYTLFMILIAALMFRPAAIEFRSKRESHRWRKFWDVVFSISSVVIALIMGILVGNAASGIPLNSSQDFVGEFSDFFRPYPILIGLLALALFTMHGGIYLLMKTEGEIHELVRGWINKLIIGFVFFYVVGSVATLIYVPHMLDRFEAEPYLLIFPILSFLSILNIPYQVSKHNDGWAFLSSSASIAFLLILYGFGTYPALVLSTIDPALNTLTIQNTASSPKTLMILLIVVGIGIPLVLAYGFWVYHIFRGKVKIEKSSY